MSDSADLKTKAKELAVIYADASKEKTAITIHEKELKKAKKEADAACVALPTSQKLQTALQNAEEKIKQLQSEI